LYIPHDAGECASPVQEKQKHWLQLHVASTGLSKSFTRMELPQ